MLSSSLLQGGEGDVEGYRGLGMGVTVGGCGGGDFLIISRRYLIYKEVIKKIEK